MESLYSEEDWQSADYNSSDGLTLKQFESFHDETKQQPAWRSNADKCAEYVDGNQLDSDVLRKQASIGMPPALEPIIGIEIDKICGLEARLRKNCRVIPNSDMGDDEIAEALNAKLNQSERHSKADKACSEAFRTQASIGVGWVEVGRDEDPFQYPYRVNPVHRNEIYWDWKGTHDPDMHDHRYLIRRRWTDKNQAKLFFPDAVELIERAATGWSQFANFMPQDGGRSTGLQMSGGSIPISYGAVANPIQGDAATSYPMLSSAYQNERGSTIEEMEWRDTSKKRVCLFECWYRTWDNALVLKMPDGRVVEYDEDNEIHNTMVALGAIQPVQAIVSKVRLSWWLGPHRLSDESNPYKHGRFPYIPFWGQIEDRTGVPYGRVRSWIYAQDELNATKSRLRWGLSASTLTQTEGIALGTPDQIRREAARSDAHITLDHKLHKDGGLFEIKRDFQLTDQQFKLMEDARNGVKRTGAGLDDEQDKNPVEQVPNILGTLFDNFASSRKEVMGLLLSLNIEDMIGDEQQIMVKGDVVNPDKVVKLNVKTIHPETGIQYLTNDISKVQLKVELEDVPSTPSYRSQQLASFSEVIKSAPENIQIALYPQMANLMDVPNKEKFLETVRKVSQQPTEQDIQKQISDAVDSALTKANVDNKGREIELKGKLQEAQIAKLAAETLLTRVTAYFESIQTGGALVATPAIAKVSDVILQSAGLTAANPAGINPQIEQAPLPTSGLPAQQTGISPVEQSTGTHPNFPARPASPASPAIGVGHGIETPRLEG